MVRFFLISLCFLIVSGCSKKKAEPEALYTNEEFNLIMDTTGSTLDKELITGINFSDYSPGVDRINSKALIYQRLSFYVVKFETETQAKNEALRLNQYYARNYLFDKVEGEPILEDMVIVKFHAMNPKRRIQRKPVIAPGAQSEQAPAAAGGH